MHIKDFKAIVSAFADPGSEILYEKTKVVFSVNGELLEVGLSTKDGDVFVDEGAGFVSASGWILRRLARLPLLASRLKESLGESKLFVSPAATLLQSLEIRPEETPI